MNTLQLTALKMDEIYKSAHILIPPFMSKVVIVTK